MVLPLVRMRVSVPNSIPKQLSKVDIVRSKFVSERIEMEQKYKKLQEIIEKSEENARIHEHKAQKMTEGFTKVKDKNENLYIANKKLWDQNKNSRIKRFFGHNEEKVKLPKESLIIGKHKQPRLKQRSITRRMSIQSSPKSYRDAARAGHSGKGKLRLTRYNTKRYWKKRQSYRRLSKY